jgi:predicted PurR-regulated permease PerM
VSDGIRRAGQVAWAVLGLAALLALVLFLAWSVRIIWGPLIFAGAIVFLLNPIVTGLHGRGVPRLVGVLLTYLGLAAVAVLGVLAVVPVVVDQADELGEEWPQIQANLQRWVNDRSEQTEGWVVSLPSFDEVESEVRSGGERSLSEQLAQARNIGGRVFQIALVLVLGPVVAFYLLNDLPRLRRVAESLVPERSRPEVLLVGRRLNSAIGGFFRGQLVVATIVGLLVSGGLALVDLPFWLLVGMIAGFSNIVPLIGPWVGAVPALIIALTTRDLSTAAWVGIIMLVVQQLESQLISPVVMNRAVKLHPAAVLLGLVAASSLFGFAGLLLAVPGVAVLKILGGHLWRTYVLGEPLAALAELAEDEHAAPGGVLRDVVRLREDGAMWGRRRGDRPGDPGEVEGALHASPLATPPPGSEPSEADVAAGPSGGGEPAPGAGDPYDARRA